MTLSAEKLINKAVEMREAGRIDEAIIAARRATAVDPEDANTWWQLGQAVAQKNGAAASITYFKKTVELADGFAYGWHRLGEAYKKTAMLGEAISSWETAIKNDGDRIDTLKALVGAYRQREFTGDEEKIFGVLEILNAKDEIENSDLNILGIGYHKKKDYHKAIKCYRKFADSSKSAAGYFNLGLALSSPGISQHADAVDYWLRALEKDPNHEKSQKRIKEILPHLIGLRKRILQNDKHLIGVDQQYRNYINPFELLNLTDVGDAFNLEIKIIQRAKKSLLHEIKIEDGVVEWVAGLKIDKSQAIKVADGLTDENDRYWHHAIFENKPLLDFMSRGSIHHFLVDGERSSIDMAKRIDEWPGEFEALVGENFAAQFDLLLTNAIEKYDVDLIKALLDGRRWVSPEQEDRCFEGAIRKIGEMLKPLRDASAQSEKIKPSVDGVRVTLVKGNMGKIIGMLPNSFQAIQQEAASLIRSISIDANNHHDDPTLAKQIMGFAQSLAGRSPLFLLKIEEDTKILDERIEDARNAKEVERIDRLLEPLRQASKKSETLKPRLESVKEILAYGNLASTLMALPTSLYHFQEEAASLIRGISIDTNNHHGDAALAKQIIVLAKSLVGRTSLLLLKIEEDTKILDERIEDDRNTKEAEKIDCLLEPLRQTTKNSEKLKPRLEGLREILAYGNLASTLMALPISLNYFQEEAASLIRGISIDAYNHHGDIDLAKDILALAKSLLRRASEFNVQLDEDMKTLDDRISKESESEAFLTFQDETYSITRKAVTFGSQRLAVEDVRTLRWGISITRNGTVATHVFTFAIGGRRTNVLTLSWSTHKNVDAQQSLFNKFINASFVYLMPRVIEMIQKDLDSDQTIRIGTAPVSRYGVTFTIEGWFSKKQEACPWHRLRSEIDNGEVVITDISNSKCRISLPLSTVDNAIALHFMINNQS